MNTDLGDHDGDQTSHEVDAAAEPIPERMIVSEELGTRIRRVLLALEGDSFSYEHDAVTRNRLEMWHCGIIIDAEFDAGRMEFEAEGPYAAALLEVATQMVPAPRLLSDFGREYPGRFILFASGSGSPENPRLIGPVDNFTLRLFENETVLEDLGLLLVPSTCYIPETVGFDIQPRVIAVLDNLQGSVLPIEPQTVIELLEEQTNPLMLEACIMLVKALRHQDADLDYLERAVNRLETMRLRARVAEGLLTLFRA